MAASGTALARPKSQNSTLARYRLATGTAGGTYYPVGVGIQQMLEATLAPRDAFEVRAITTAGSFENIDYLAEDTAQIAFCQALFARHAHNGEGPWEDTGPVSGLRSVAGLWPNVEHFIARPGVLASAQAGELIDRPLRINLGNRRSGAAGSARHLLRSLGVDLRDDTSLYYMGYLDSVRALTANTVDLVCLPGGVPVAAVTRAFRQTRGRCQLLNFTPAQVESADGGYGLWRPYRVSTAAYQGMTAPVMTLAQPNVMLARRELPAAHVYRMLKGIFEHSRFLYTVHPAVREMQLARSLEALVYPLHPGAQRFFEEQGVVIPDALQS